MSVVAASNLADSGMMNAVGAQFVESGTVMARWEQFEIWQKSGDKWELLAAFPDLDLAQTMARSRNVKSRLLRATYEDDRLVEQDVIAELGATRDIA